MKQITLAVALFISLFATLNSAAAQCNGNFGADSACGTVGGGLPGPIPFSSIVSGGGAVIGPGTTTIGCAAPWANTTGTLLGNDCDLSIRNVFTYPEQSNTTGYSNLFMNPSPLSPTAGGYTQAQNVISARMVPGATTPGAFGWVVGYFYGEPGTASGANMAVLNPVGFINSSAEAANILEIGEGDIANNYNGGCGLRPSPATICSVWSAISGGTYDPSTAFLVYTTTSAPFHDGLWMPAGSVINGIDIGSASSSLLANVVFGGKQLANNVDTIVLQRFTDASSTGYFLRGVNTADNANLFYVDVNGNASFTSYYIGAIQALGIGGGYTSIQGGDGTARVLLASVSTQSLFRDTQGFAFQTDGGTTYAQITSAGVVLSGSASGAGTLAAPAAASTYVWTLPAATDTIAGIAATQTLTNKTIAFASNTLTGVAPLASPSFTGTASFAGQIVGTYGTPTIASGGCGATTNGTLASGATNQFGEVIIGAASTTSCTIAFSATLGAAPLACILFPGNAQAATELVNDYVSAITTAHFVITGTALANTDYYYHCV